MCKRLIFLISFVLVLGLAGYAAADAGIKGDYYNNITASGKIVLTHIDPNINFDWGEGSPDPNVGDEDGDKWSVRWTAEINVPDTNTYTFTTVRAPITNGVRLWINGQRLISRWTTSENPGDEPYEDSATIALDAGMVPIMMEFYDDSPPQGVEERNAKAQLWWQRPFGPNEIIPDSAFFLPQRSVLPNPQDDATNVRSDPILSWVSGEYADTRDVYFGTDEDEVTDRDANALVDSNTRDVNYYDPGLLEFNTTYYWRVVDINDSNWPSDVWSFTTGAYHVVDDMEKYNSTINDAWKTSAGGASITTSTDPYMAGIVHEGYEAMAYSYNNSIDPCYSEAYAEANSPHIGNIVGKNWRLKDVNFLSLWFHGQGVPDIRGRFDYNDVNGVYTIEADGRGMPGSGKAESFYFVYGQYNGNCASIYAKVLNVEKTDPYAKAGVMIRDTLDQDARYGAVVFTLENGVIFQYRATAGGAAAYVPKPEITDPCWVKVERTCGYPGFVRGYYATTPGVPTYADWKEIGGQPQVTLGAPIYLGLCVTSSSYCEMCTAEISNVTTLPVTPLTSSKDIGRVYNDPAPMYVALEDSSEHKGTVNHIDPYVTQEGNDCNWTQWCIDLNEFSYQDVNVCDVNRIYIGFGNEVDSTGLGIVYIDDIRLYLSNPCKPCETPPTPNDINYPETNCGGSYTVWWADSNGATYYVLEVNDGSGWEPVQNYNGTDTCYDATVGPGSYLYQVRACNDCGCSDPCIGDHNCVVTLIPEAPNNINYPETNCGGSYTVCWAPSNGATYYELERFPDGGTIYNGPNTCYDDSVGAGSYLYQVRACNYCGCSDWCTGDHNCVVTEFSPDKPKSITVPGTNCDGNYTVSWTPAESNEANVATYYELDVNDGNGWDPDPVYSGPNTCYEFENVDPGTYRYHVRACNACGCSDYCEGGNYCIVARTPDAPASITVPPLSDPNSRYTVSWTPSAGAISYQLESKSNYTPSIPDGWVQVYCGPDTFYEECKVGGGTWSYRVRATADVNLCTLCPSAWTYSQNDCNVSDCLIGGNAGPKEPNDWKEWRYPSCWCYEYQCRGDINGKKTTLWRVQSADLTLFRAAFFQKDPELAAIPNGICADLNHIKTTLWRVQSADLTIFRTYFFVKDPGVPSCDQEPIYTGPYNFWTSPCD